MTIAIPEYVDGLPTIAGHEAELDKAIRAAAKKEVFPAGEQDRLRPYQSACAIALHMHQPLIPAGGYDLRTAAIISNLKYMMDNQGSATTTTRRCSSGATNASANSSRSSSTRGKSRASCWSIRAPCCTGCGRWGSTTYSTC